MNSGDWVENLTSLEYSNGEWSIYHYDEKDFKNSKDISFKGSDVREGLVVVLSVKVPEPQFEPRLIF